MEMVLEMETVEMEMEMVGREYFQLEMEIFPFPKFRSFCGDIHMSRVLHGSRDLCEFSRLCIVSR